MHLKVSLHAGATMPLFSQGYFEYSSYSVILLEGLAITVALTVKEEDPVILESYEKIIMSEVLLYCSVLPYVCTCYLFSIFFIYI